MAGRLKKIAAVTIAALGLGDSCAAEGPEPAAAYAIPRPGSTAPAELRLTGGDSLERWQLSAGAARHPWDPLETSAIGAFGVSRPLRAAWRDALGGDRRTRFGVTIAAQDSQPLFGMPGSRSIAVRSGSDSADERASLKNAFHGAERDLENARREEGATALAISQQLRPARALTLDAGAQVQRYRIGIESPGSADTTRFAGTLPSMRAAVSFAVAPGTQLFARVTRGPDERSESLAAVDPRSGAALPVLDPRAHSDFTEAGLRSSWGGVDTRLSAWRAGTASELRFSGTESWSEIARAGVRSGVRATLRYEPRPWLAFDLDATVLRARYGDGAGEPIAFAAGRFATAGATLRGMGGWTATLFVSYLGPPLASGEDQLRLRSSTVVNAQLTRKLSRTTRLTFDVFNVFDHRVGDIDHFAASRIGAAPGAMDSFLFHPAEPRGFRLKVRTTF